MKQFIFVVFLLFLFLSSCTKRLKTGDLLFQNLDCGGFCEAIEAVTPAYKGKYFSHVGIVVEIDGQIKVLEAVSKGVVITDLNDFLKRTNFEDIYVGRIKKNIDLKLISITELDKYIGKPYDTIFSIENNAYYCSELVYFLFRNTENKPIFELKPMTFKKPRENNFFELWEDYFGKMNVKIPEGQLGINPGQIINCKLLDISNLPLKYLSMCKNAKN